MTDLPLSPDDPEIIDLAEFSTYRDILGCAAVPIVAAALIVPAILSGAGAPHWVSNVVGAVFVTFPFAAFVRWTWDKKAVRLRSGRIVTQAEMRRSALILWGLAIVLLLGQLALTEAIALIRGWIA